MNPQGALRGPTAGVDIYRGKNKAFSVFYNSFTILLDKCISGFFLFLLFMESLFDVFRCCYMYVRFFFNWSCFIPVSKDAEILLLSLL
jgi:hypothetical protein